MQRSLVDSRAAAPRASRGRTGPRGVASSHDTPLLLDTHVWVWLLAGDIARLHTDAGAHIERACALGQCFVSDVSAWEVATKSARGVLALSMDPAAWLDEATRAPGISSLAVSRDVLVASARLPDTLPDMADRLLVATSLRYGLAVLTADPVLLAFGKTWPLFRVLDARA